MENPRRLVLEIGPLRFDALALGPETGDLVLLLHGFPQFADSWLPVMHALAQAGLRAVAFDQRGYSPGARPPRVADYALPHLVADVLAVADALHAPTFHLVGHDWGGLVAWQLAADHPHRLRTVTVLSTPHTTAFSTTVRTDLDQMNKSKYILLFKAPRGIPETTLLAFDAMALRACYQGIVASDQVESNLRRLSEQGTLTAALNWYRALSPSAQTGKVHVPTLYIWGENDVALGEKAALATAGYVEGPYRFERIPRASHWLVDEAPARMSTLILEHHAAHRAP